MKTDGPSEKIERAILGLLDFGWRLVRTFWAIGLHPRWFVSSLNNDGEKRGFLPPNAFVLSCVVVLGLLGKILSAGIEDFEPAVIQQFKDLTLWFFVIEIVSTFAVAIAGSVLARYLVGDGIARKRGISDVSYYAVGFFAVEPGTPLHAWAGLVQRVLCVILFSCLIVLALRLSPSARRR